MTTLRNLIDVLAAHARRLPHMLDQPISVQVEDKKSPMSQCLIGVDTNQTLLTVMPPTEPGKKSKESELKSESEPKDNMTVIQTMRGPMSVPKA